MGDSLRNPGGDTGQNQSGARSVESQGSSNTRLVDWHLEPSRTGSKSGEARVTLASAGGQRQDSTNNAKPVHETFKLADAKESGSDKPTPGFLTVNYSSASGLDKPVGPDVVHLTINSPKSINMATNLIYGRDGQGREIEPYFHTVIGEPNTTQGMVLRGQFDISPNLQDITLHYTDEKGVVQNRTYPASALRLEGTAGRIDPHANDFLKPDAQRPVSQQYPATTSIYEFGYRLSDISGKALGFMERQLYNDKLQDKTGNPYIDINLAEVRVGLAMQHYINAYDEEHRLIRPKEKEFAMTEMQEAKKNYNSAIDLAQKQMSALPNPGSLTPHSYLDPLGRRFAPQRPYGDDYYPLVYGSAIDTANWRKMQLDLLQGMMSVNGQLPPRQSTRSDQP